MPSPRDLIHETSVTTGTGNFTLAAVNGKVRFSDATYGFGTGGANVFDYYISNQGATEWERGTGSMSAASTLVRDTVLKSSNGDALVNFSAGTKDITNDVPAAIQYGGVVTRRAITGADTIVAADRGNVVEATSGTFTLAFTAAATLGNGFSVIVVNSGTGNVTLEPDGAEQIDGATNWILYPGGSIIVHCTGTAFESYALSGMSVTFAADGTFTKPLAAGLSFIDVEAWGGGGSGGRGGAGDGGGGGGGGGYNWRNAIPLSAVGTTETVTVGTGAAAIAVDDTDGTAGENTTFGSLLSAFGGGGGESASVFGGGGGGGTTAAGAAGGTGAGGVGGAGYGRLAAAAVDNTSVGVEGFNGGTAGTNISGNTWGGAGGVNIATVPGARSIYGGGGGGGGSATNTNSAGGASVWGGGGGGGGSDTGTGSAGGMSTYGGSGGAGGTGAGTGTAGTVPGGGGGGSESANSGAGAGGRVVVYVY